jgi:glyoxylase-like metal-dependent hydrolase (beta-lactamase superfamily II)
MEIVRGIHLIDGVQCNCYLLENNGLSLIDTGYPGQTGSILNYMKKKLGRTPSDLKTIILTHCDIDHIGNARNLREITGARIAIHKVEAEYVAGRKTRLGPNPARWDIDAVYKAIAGYMGLIKVQPFEADITVEEEDELAGLRVISAPGHTAGSMALYEPDKRILFSGDSMIYTGKRMHGSPDRVTMNPSAASESFHKLMKMDFDILLGGHGKPLMPDASSRIAQLPGD